MGRLVASLLYGVSTHDPAVLAGAAVLLAFIGLAAILTPALRAARNDPPPRSGRVTGACGYRADTKQIRPATPRDDLTIYRTAMNCAGRLGIWSLVAV